MRSLRQFLRLLGSYAVLVAAGACTQATIKTARDPSFAKTIDRLAVLIADRDAANAAILKQALSKHLEETRTVSLVMAISDEKAMDASEQEAKAFHPDGVLVIVTTATVVMPNGAPVQGQLDASLWVPDMAGARVWRAQVKHQTNLGVGQAEGRLDHAATAIVQRLLVDRMVSPR